MIEELADFLSALSFFDLRCLARLAGVSAPSKHRKSELVAQLCHILCNKEQSGKKAKSGRPPLSMKNMAAYEEILEKAKSMVGFKHDGCATKGEQEAEKYFSLEHYIKKIKAVLKTDNDFEIVFKIVCALEQMRLTDQ